mmetsp:Transcript_3892/g.7491  ORF Transcript_3892/g.7491 Transcript_3892/m.7491 type:complete len:453 (+) Transcript_3892:62-1420(+)
MRITLLVTLVSLLSLAAVDSFSVKSPADRTVRLPTKQKGRLLQSDGYISSSSSSSSSSYSSSSSLIQQRASTSQTESDNVSLESISRGVAELKKILAREYATFFSPMETQYYAKDVSFTDPMTSLAGVQSYQNNVDMLASRTLLGKVLFSDAGIVLHNISGGTVQPNGSIEDIVTRWTLRLTAKILPWKPTARFSGISVYKVIAENASSSASTTTSSTPGTRRVTIVEQTDYWDSINIVPNSGGQYQKVDKGKAINDFLNQLSPGGFVAQTAAPELPYQLLRRGDEYEVRRYPSFTGIQLPYKRRDEGFGSLGAFTKGMSPLSPALMDVQKDDISDKYMMWPLTFARPGEMEPAVPQEATDKAGEGQWRTMRVVHVPSKVVAVREFSDASMEPVVRKADRELRELLQRDGLRPTRESEDVVRFAQYDAIFSMGKRRGEVWIDLGDDGGHPFD